MIKTSNYNNCTKYYLVCSISGDKGKDANYEGPCYPDLAPKKSFFEIWHKNIGKISEEENNYYYISEYYKQVLSKLDAEKVYDELDGSTLLCYENSEEFCHRHIVASWLELLLGIQVPEIKVTENKIEYLKRPSYIKEYLEQVMKENLDMKGFNSLRALYLFDKANELDKQAIILRDETNSYNNIARLYRRDVIEEEMKYNDNKKLR